MDSCVRSLARVLIGVVAAGVVASSAWAGVMDDVPLINGTDKAKTIFLIPGVIVDQGDTGTSILCTSLEKTKDTLVAVEIFNENGGDALNDITAADGVLTLVPGATKTFEIVFTGDNVPGTAFDELIELDVNVFTGSARVVATGKRIMCTAAVFDVTDNPPISVRQLNVVVKKQKGD